MKVHELLSDPSKWCTWTGAKDEAGKPINPLNEKAACWCLGGAIHKCYGDKSEDIFRLLAREILKSGVYIQMTATAIVVSWNDNHQRTFEEVQKLLTELDV